MDTATTAAIIIALTDTIKRLVPAPIQGVVTQAVAVLLGIGIALLNSTDPLQGAVNGLVAIGAVTVAGRVGK